MADKNYISVDGNGNITLQDITGRDISINDTKEIKRIFENTEPEYIQKLYKQIDDNYKIFVENNDVQIQKVIALLQEQISERKISVEKSKNILTGTISNVGGNVHIGDVIYQNSEKRNSNKLVIYIVLIVAFIATALVVSYYGNFFNKNIEAELIDTTKNKIDTLIEPISDTLKIIPIETEVVNKIEEKKVENLSIKVWTNNGSSPTFTEDDNVKIFFEVNRACYVRLIYEMADGTAVLLADNLKVEAKDINKQLSPEYDFTCAEPFGNEILYAYVQLEKFTPLETQVQSGYEFIVQPLKDAYALSEKGLRKNIQFTKKTIKVKTQSKN